MASIKIYNEVNGKFYSVNYELKRAILNTGVGEYENYLLITTDIKKWNGSAFEPVIIKNLTDVPDDGGSASATDFTDLCQRYAIYFQTVAAFTQSSSSSSSVEFSSSSSSSSVEFSSSSSSSVEFSSSSSSSSVEFSSSSSSSDSSSSRQSDGEGHSFI